jgi:hypothetical protein
MPEHSLSRTAFYPPTPIQIGVGFSSHINNLETVRQVDSGQGWNDLKLFNARSHGQCGGNNRLNALDQIWLTGNVTTPHFNSLPQGARQIGERLRHNSFQHRDLTNGQEIHRPDTGQYRPLLL